MFENNTNNTNTFEMAKEEIRRPVIVESILGKTAYGNNHTPNVAVFFDKEEKVAFAGTRKYYGEGETLVLAKGELIPQDCGDLPVAAGLLNLAQKEVHEGTLGLPAKRLPDGKQEFLSASECLEKFEVIGETTAQFEILVSPKKVLKFIDAALDGENVMNRVISFMPTAQYNALGIAAAVIEKELAVSGDYYVAAVGIKRFLIENQEDIDDILVGMSVYFEYKGVTLDALGREVMYGKVVSDYKPGVMMSIQHYTSGTRMGKDDPFVIFDGQNGVKLKARKTMPFIEGQNEKSACRMPMVTFALDALQSVMHAMSGYDVVEMRFLKNGKLCHVRPTTADDFLHVEALIAPRNPHVIGKILTF